MRQPSLICAAVVLAAAASASALPPRYDHVVLVIIENVNYSQVIGSANAPYINSLRAGGTSLDRAYAFLHTSAPNYGELFAGNDSGITDGAIPAGVPFTTPNLGASLRQAGSSFTGYAQSLPEPGSTVFLAGDYARRHNPWVNWQNDAPTAHPNQLPSSVNLPFTAFPTDFTTLPAFSLVVPDNAHNMHDGSTPARITLGDTWLRDNLDAYAQWAKTHNSLLIVTADEDAFNLNNNANRIPTVFYGAHVRPGTTVPQSLTLHNLLRTLEDTAGAAHSGTAKSVRPITGPFVTDPQTQTATFRNGLDGYGGTRDTLLRQDQPATAFPTLHKVSVSLDDNTAAGSQPTQMLIRFDDVIGPAASQIPAGATVTSAKLIIWTNSSSDAGSTTPIAVHRMLAPWAESATWNSLTAGISTNDTEAAAAADFAHEFATIGHPQFIDISDAVQSYTDGAANYGWAVLATSNDNYLLNTSDAMTPVDQRPTLEVTYARLPRWKAASPGSWASAGNWSFGVPDSAGASARFSADAPAGVPSVDVTLDGDRTVGNLAMASATAHYLLPGTAGSVLHIDNGGIAPAEIKVSRGHHVIVAPTAVDDFARVDAATATGLTFSGGVMLAAGKTLTKTGPGDLTFTGAPATLTPTSSLDLHQGQTNVAATSALLGRGNVALRYSAKLTLAGPADLSALSLHGAPGKWQSTLDLTDSFLVLHPPAAQRDSALTMIEDQIAFAHNGGTWDGPGGITSSIAAADAQHLTTVAVLPNWKRDGTALYSTFNGIEVDADSILVAYALAGDADLSGRITVDDYHRIDLAFANHWPGYHNGDFDYDGGPPDGDDYFLIDRSFQDQSNGLAAGAPIPVPEPTTGAVMCAVASGLLLRRRDQSGIPATLLSHRLKRRRVAVVPPNRC
jgi:hypothetical protein